MNITWEMDEQNERIVAYMPEITNKEIELIEEKFLTESTGKIIIYTLSNYSHKLEKLKFKKEAEMEGFFNGEAAQIMTRYIKEDRGLSKYPEEANEVLKIVGQDKKDLSQVKTDYHLELVKEKELPELAALFKTVFPVYPTNVYDPEYLKKAMETDYIFITAKNDKHEIIGAASAMKSGFGSAEITDCAVLPEYRGKQILHGIILALEQELVKQGIFNSYSITRSISAGMNMTVKRLGYLYQGTLTNNCIISTGFEDMNIWTKRLI